MPPLRDLPSPLDDEGQECVKRPLFPGDNVVYLPFMTTSSNPRGGPRRGRRSPTRGGSGGDARFATLFLGISTVVASLALFATVVTMDVEKIMREYNNDDGSGIGIDDEPREPSFDSKLARTIRNASIGSLGPVGTNRQHMRYYDALFYAALQYGADAESVLEVGCASDPFVDHLDWINERTCVAPYFESYERYAVGGGGGGGGVVRDVEEEDAGGDNNSTSSIERITADFMDYEPPDGKMYDLLLCNQVLEHVPRPASFMKKLISSAKTSIISVPFNWDDCGEECAHVSHRITAKKLLGWSAPHVPVYQGIITDNHNNSKFARRIILVFQTSTTKTTIKKKAKSKSPMDFFKKKKKWKKTPKKARTKKH